MIRLEIGLLSLMANSIDGLILKQWMGNGHNSIKPQLKKNIQVARSEGFSKLADYLDTVIRFSDGVVPRQFKGAKKQAAQYILNGLSRSIVEAKIQLQNRPNPRLEICLQGIKSLPLTELFDYLSTNGVNINLIKNYLEKLATQNTPASRINLFTEEVVKKIKNKQNLELFIANSNHSIAIEFGLGNKKSLIELINNISCNQNSKEEALIKIFKNDKEIDPVQELKKLILATESEDPKTKLIKLFCELLGDLFNTDSIEKLAHIAKNQSTNYSETIRRLNYIKNNFDLDISDKSRSFIFSHLKTITNHQPDYNKPFTQIDDKNGIDLFPFTNEHIQEMAKRIVADSPPYAFVNQLEKYKKSQANAIRVAKRASQTYFGFPAFTIDTKRIVSGKESTLAEYGQDFFESFDRLNHSKIEQFPGNGFYLSRMKLAPALGFGNINSDSHPELHTSFLNYLDQFKKQFPWLERGLNDCTNAEYITARGFQAVIPPSKKEYLIKDQNGTRIHYSYIVFNQHFNNNSQRQNKYDVSKAFLVPTKVLRKFIDPYRIPNSDYTGFNHKIPDFCDSNITREELEKAAAEENANILNLSWASNLGGLANAFPPLSKPYHEWENLRIAETKDALRHVHKSHKRGGYHSKGDTSDVNALKPFREAEDDVYATSDGCQQLVYMFNLGLANLHKGIANSSTLIQDQTIDFENTDTVNPELNNLNAKSYMLDRAIGIHESLKAKNADQNAFPILFIANTFNNGNKPPLYPRLDTHDLRLEYMDSNDQVRSIDLANKGKEIQEMHFIEHFIKPTINAIDKDPRFYVREGLSSAKVNKAKAVFDKIAYEKILC